MVDWVLIPSLVALRAEFNKRFPKRDKTSDGSVGDLRHAVETSDHNPDETGRPEVRDADHLNEVHAIDVDRDLRDPVVTMEMVVNFLVARCRAGQEKRIRYIIFNRTIWTASSGWKARPYTGANPHDKHCHISGSYDTARERDTSPFGVATFRLPAPPESTTGKRRRPIIYRYIQGRAA